MTGILLKNMRKNYMEQFKYPVVYNDEIANRCIYGASFVRELLGIENHTKIYHKDIIYPMSSRKVEGFPKDCRRKKLLSRKPR